MYNIDRSIKDRILKSYDKKEVELHQHNLVGLASEGRLLLKPEYYSYALRYIDALISLLEHAPRILDSYEEAFIGELALLKERLSNQEIHPPLGGHNGYPSFIETRFSLTDIPHGEDF